MVSPATAPLAAGLAAGGAADLRFQVKLVVLEGKVRGQADDCGGWLMVAVVSKVFRENCVGSAAPMEQKSLAWNGLVMVWKDGGADGESVVDGDPAVSRRKALSMTQKSVLGSCARRDSKADYQNSRLLIRRVTGFLSLVCELWVFHVSLVRFSHQSIGFSSAATGVGRQPRALRTHKVCILMVVTTLRLY